MQRGLPEPLVPPVGKENPKASPGSSSIVGHIMGAPNSDWAPQGLQGNLRCPGSVMKKGRSLQQPAHRLWQTELMSAGPKQ